jgi:methylated-DNA-[protein]-cysteine S-methyltransferase
MPGRLKKASVLSASGKPETAVMFTPIGALEISGSGRGVRSIVFAGRRRVRSGRTPACLKVAVRQIDEYFRGKRKKFTVKLDIGGTPFQKKVWRELLKIPFGKTASYADIASATGNPRACRAVGGANHRNPVPIIVPCHRVVGSGGGLTGYGGGLERKAWLLIHERNTP